MSNPEISVLAPVYNEQETLPEFYRQLKETLQNLKLSHEIIFINDGSVDNSMEILQRTAAVDKTVKILDFSRNFGHQIAIKAGIDHASGGLVVIIDSDLQDPPTAIREMVAKCREGYDVVYAVRTSRQGESLFKKWTAHVYYRLIRRAARIDIPLDTGDFRLMTRRVAIAIRDIREKNPYLRGLISWVGFRQIGIPIQRQSRYAGQTKYSYGKMLSLAWSGITHFSFLPLQLATWIGFLLSLVCLVFILVAMYQRLILHITVPGWASLMVVVLFLGGVQLITLGILGSYLAKNYDESRPRPLYVLRDKEGF